MNRTVLKCDPALAAWLLSNPVRSDLYGRRIEVSPTGCGNKLAPWHLVPSDHVDPIDASRRVRRGATARQ